MANTIASNPWQINTLPFSYTLSYVFVKDIVWSSFAVSNTLTITDRNGNIIVNATVGASDSNLTPIRFGPMGWVNGLIVTVLGGGNVTIPITKG